MKIINNIIVATVFCLSLNAQELNSVNTNSELTSKAKPLYQGNIEEIIHSGGYTYLLIKEKSPGYSAKELKSFWIAVTKIDAKIGDHVRFKKELSMKNFKSKLLQKTFPELMFASELEYKVSN